jgi:hypothetical protein
MLFLPFGPMYADTAMCSQRQFRNPTAELLQPRFLRLSHVREGSGTVQPRGNNGGCKVPSLLELHV